VLLEKEKMNYRQREEERGDKKNVVKDEKGDRRNRKKERNVRKQRCFLLPYIAQFVFLRKTTP
jgi:hypothetical protein